MRLRDLFRRAPAQTAAAALPLAQSGPSQRFNGMNDPALKEFIRAGGGGDDDALTFSAVWRAVELISATVGMLPLNVMEKRGDQISTASTHGLQALLTDQPNTWQTPFEFKQLLTFNYLEEGDGYGLIVRGVGNRPIAIVPLVPKKVTPTQNSDWTISYRYQRPDGTFVTYAQSDILHLRGLSRDGIKGLSRMKMACKSIALALSAQASAHTMMEKGVSAGGALSTDLRLSTEAYKRLKASMEEDYSGDENAGKWMILEDGLKPQQFRTTANDLQSVENRKMQVEEAARFFGIPRPLLMMDDTSWGSGIEQLAIFFVQYGLAPIFVIWEEALNRVCLTKAERSFFYTKFNAHALLRGSLKDQADFFAKALGSGGHRPWMVPNEVREKLDQNPRPDGDDMTPITQTGGASNAPA